MVGSRARRRTGLAFAREPVARACAQSHNAVADLHRVALRRLLACAGRQISEAVAARGALEGDLLGAKLLIGCLLAGRLARVDVLAFRLLRLETALRRLRASHEGKRRHRGHGQAKYPSERRASRRLHGGSAARRYQCGREADEGEQDGEAAHGGGYSNRALSRAKQSLRGRRGQHRAT